MKQVLEWTFENQEQKVVILSPEEFETSFPDLFSRSMLSRTKKRIEFCQVLNYKGILSGNFVIPRKNRPIKKQDVFSFVLDGSTLYFIDYDDTVKKMVEKMDKDTISEYSTVLMFLLDFMSFLINEDVYYLEDYNAALEHIEVEMYNGKHAGLESFIMTTRRDMNILSGYYLQLNNMGQSLEEIFILEKKQEAQSLLNLYISRVSLLYSMVQQVKDNTDQIWNLRQTMLSDKQNQISTVLTVVSVIFLPLTLITGWFGMNFAHMPLLKMKYGYPGTFIFCMMIFVGELLYIKKKGLWK